MHHCFVHTDCVVCLCPLQKKSREESEGEGSAVEILKNHPYSDGPNGSGQYTYKVRGGWERRGR